MARPLVDSGARDRLTSGVAYATLTHRYWYGVAMEGGGHDLGIGGPAPMLAVLAYHRLSPPPLPRQAPWSTSPALMAAQVRAAIADGWQLVTPGEAAEFLEDAGRIPLRSLLLTFDDGYADMSDRALPVLDDLGATAVAFIPSAKIGGWADWGDDPGPNPSPLLDADQVRTLAASGRVEFGAHGATHVALPGLAGEALAREVDGARDELESLGLPRPRFLAYPYGEHDIRVRRAVAPYAGSFTTQPGLVVPGGDWTRLPRVEVLAGLTPRGLVWRLRRLSWEEGARRAALAARRRGARLVRRLRA
jgi:peptidoglycan/xylan/chitin deacetylase (PgdA/CDA1 family)